MTEVIIKNQMKTIKMCELKPLQMARVSPNTVNPESCNNHIVMRTASIDKVEVMDLTSPGPNECWTGEPSLMVELLPDGFEVKLINRS